LNQDWIKHGKISQFVFATKKSFNSDYEDLDTEDLLCPASSTTVNDDAVSSLEFQWRSKALGGPGLTVS